MGLFPAHDHEYAAVYAQEAAMVDASEIIAEALEASGMSKAELARALNVSRSEVTERLRGDRNITVRNLAATLHALGATLELAVRLPATAESSVRVPVDIDEYRKWSAPLAGQHYDQARPVGKYAISGRQ